MPHHVPPVAVNDGAVFLQPAANVIHATLNDYSPSADSFCITTVYGGVPGASVLNCGNISFNPDSAFTGNDSIFYVICNTNQPTLCDTGLVVVTVDPNPLLAPITNFNIYPMECQGVITVNQSSNADSVVWSSKPIWNNFYADSNFSQQDTAQYGFRTNGLYLQVCLTSFNRFGSSVKCDSLETACLGIDEIQLSGVRMYPNPASNILTIDLRANRAAVSEYSSIIIYNAIGQKIIALNKNSQVDLLEIPVENLQAGIYLATIVTVDGTSSVLGNFTVIK